MEKINYKDSGVDIDEGNALVQELKALAKSTFNPHVLTGIGSFSGAYELPKGYKEPVLLAASDGVGTKISLAARYRAFEGIGIDLVAMCVNDLICNFAKPLFFLDYYASGKLKKKEALEVIKGIAKGCIEAGCALIGGESAEMPGLYKENDFDLAGFALGVAEKAIITQKNPCQVGDLLVALPSSGVHANGFSLIHKIIQTHKLSLSEKINGKPLYEVLLEPTKIYVNTIQSIQDSIQALAHITGGGLVENVPRCLPDNLKALIFEQKIQRLPIFDFLAHYVQKEELYRVFNMGIGMVLVVHEQKIDWVLAKTGGYVIGKLEPKTDLERIKFA